MLQHQIVFTGYFRVLTVMLAAVLLSACAAPETRWTHPEISADEWGVDAAQCKWDARRKAEKEFGDNIQ